MPLNRRRMGWAAAAWVGLWIAWSGAAALAADGGLRTWTAATGISKIEAQFVSHDGKLATFKRKNGKPLEVPLARLSPSDRAFIASITASAEKNAAASQGREDFRLWTAATEMRKLEAKLVSYDGKNVTLLLKDGPRITIPAFCVSPEDRAFLAPPDKAAPRSASPTAAEPSAAAEGFRLWSSFGAEKVEAKFLSYKRGTVTLLLKNGKQFDLHYTGMSLEDRKFLFSILGKAEEQKNAVPDQEQWADDAPWRKGLEGFRVWTDSTGKMKLKAKFLSQSDDGGGVMVTLEKTDGGLIKIFLKNFSEADRQLLKLQSEDPRRFTHMRLWTDATEKFRVRAKLLSHIDHWLTLETEAGWLLTIASGKLSRPDRVFARKADDAGKPQKLVSGGVFLRLRPTLEMLAAPRTWSDPSGKFQIEARLLAEKDGAIKLRKKDGKEIVVALAKLSGADQRYVTELVKNLPDSPFLWKKSLPLTTPAAPKQGGFDLAQVPRVALALAPKEWSVAPDPVAEAAAPTGPIEPPLVAVDARFTRLAVGPRARTAVATFVIRGDDAWQHSLAPSQGAVTQIARCDLVLGTWSAPLGVAGYFEPMAVHPDGRHLVVRSGNALEVWTFDGSELTRNFRWPPYAERKIERAQFLGDRHLMTISGRSAVIWSFPEIEPLHRLSHDGENMAASPDGRLLAYWTREANEPPRIGLFDVEQGQVIAQQAVPNAGDDARLAFSPSGRRLACATWLEGQASVLVYDVASGKISRTFPLRYLDMTGRLSYVSEKFLLFDDHRKGKLIDLENQVHLWDYRDYSTVQTVAGTTFFRIGSNDREPYRLLAVQLPDAAARDAGRRVAADPDLPKYFKPNMTVQLNVNGVTGGGREQVREALTEQLRKMKCSVGGEGEIEVVARIEDPKKIMLEFLHFFSDGEKEQVAFPLYTSVLEVKRRGETVWKTSGSNRPFTLILRLKKGQTIADYLQQYHKPDLRVFLEEGVPPTLHHTLGYSVVNAAGVQEAPAK